MWECVWKKNEKGDSKIEQMKKKRENNKFLFFNLKFLIYFMLFFVSNILFYRAMFNISHVILRRVLNTKHKIEHTDGEKFHNKCGSKRRTIFGWELDWFSVVDALHI